jgi:WD40 repeat protein
MVQDVRYAPSGDHYASGGSDMKLFLYDGKTGDTLAEFTENGHKGSIVRFIHIVWLAQRV